MDATGAHPAATGAATMGGTTEPPATVCAATDRAAQSAGDERAAVESAGDERAATDGAAHAAEPVIELHDAVALLGGFPALAGVNLTVPTGEILALQGANGAGKTTLLRLIGGALSLERGRGRVLGHDLATERAAVRAEVGMLGHRNGLYLDLTVTENVRYWAALVGAGDHEVTAALDRLGLSGRLAHLAVRRLSAGQKRRTALAAFVVRRARLWLLDEPHNGLDADARDDLDVLVRQAAAAGATVVIASHELDRVGELATRTVTVAGGVVSERSGHRFRAEAHEIHDQDGEGLPS